MQFEMLMKQFNYPADRLFNRTEILAVVAGNKAKLEFFISDIALPAVVQLFFNNGSLQREIGTTAIVDSFKKPRECMLWRKIDQADEWFFLQRLYCSRRAFRENALDLEFKYSLTTYPIESRYRGTFLFKVAAKRNIYWSPYLTGTRMDYLLHKEIVIVAKNWVDPNSLITIQNYDQNYPFIFDIRPNVFWVRQGASTEISLFMSNFELPVYLHQKFNVTSHFTLLYSINAARSICKGKLENNDLIHMATIKSCSQPNSDGQYTVVITLRTAPITPKLAGEGFLAASYNTTIDEASYQLVELAWSRLTISSYKSACRAQNDITPTDVFPERVGSSAFVSCAASCSRPGSNLIIGLEGGSTNGAGRFRAVCENRVPRQMSGTAGKVVPDCRGIALTTNSSDAVIAVFELREFDPSMEGQYYCTVDDQGQVTQYPVSIYLQKYSTLIITGNASNLFESIGEFTSLTCYAVGGQPSPEITWLIGGEVAKLNATYYSPSLSRGNSTSVLSLPMSSEYNGMDVKCQTIAYGILRPISSKPIAISFYHLPLEVPDQIIDSNSSVNVTCNIFKSNPPIDLKSCTMTTFDGRETNEYNPIPETPIVVASGQSLKVHCICQYSFGGRSSISETMIYVNWRGAVDMEMEAKIMHHVTVFVMVAIGGLAALPVLTLVILRLNGYTGNGILVPDDIVRQLERGGELVISSKMSKSGGSQIILQHRSSAIVTARTRDSRASRAAPTSVGL